MKKLRIVILTAILILALCACGSEADTAESAVEEDGPSAIMAETDDDSAGEEVSEAGGTDAAEEADASGDTEETTDGDTEEDSSEDSGSEEDASEDEEAKDDAAETASQAESQTSVTADTVSTGAATTESVTSESAETDGTEESSLSSEELKSIAEGYIDEPVSSLYAAIGEPDSSDYAPSCLGDGEDGELFYDGFTVYTYREGDEETVTYVE